MYVMLEIFLKEIGENLQKIYPEVIDGIQGMGCMLGIRLKQANVFQIQHVLHHDVHSLPPLKQY